jgi:putative ABC transport system ATP-binding protein
MSSAEREPVVEMAGVSTVYGAVTGWRKPWMPSISASGGEFVLAHRAEWLEKTPPPTLVAGSRRLDRGASWWTGDSAPPRRRSLADLRLQRIGFIFQNFNLIPALSVAENVSWPLEFAGHSRAE